MNEPSCRYLLDRVLFDLRGWSGAYHKGHAACVRAAKAWEAHNRRSGDEAAGAAGRCAWPWKTAYESRAAVDAAFRRMHRSKKSMGLHPYPCPAGHWHLGRNVRRSLLAWKAAA